MLLAEIVSTSNAVAATRSRKAKVTALAECLAATSRNELPVVTAYLSGTLLQRRTGLGWRSLNDLPAPAAEPSLSVEDVHEAFERMSQVAGAGSQVERKREADALFGAATEAEQAWLRGVVTGEVRQGALDSLVQEAIAAAAEVPLPAVRRAAMLAGSTVVVAGLAFDGEEALAEVGLVVGRPVLPMLASSAGSVEEAMSKLGEAVLVDTKLDGIRIQAHKSGSEVRIATRTLEDITSRLPEVAEIVSGFPAESLVLDGEAMTLGPDGRPRPFQETASRTATRSAADAVVAPYFFDILHVDGRDLIDLSLDQRITELDRIVPEQHRPPRLVTVDAEEAERFAADAITSGHEGVVVKGVGLPWEAGRRGSGWIKVKPVHTLDLVVLGIEWGSGRRKGWLSNIHLGARGPDGFVMIGKTFKGMTDQILAWQTERFTELAVDGTDDWQVRVRPEQVVEIAFDGVQRSTRYPGGVALRFARVVRYRDDKKPEEADTIDTVRAYLP
ncbi:DNA ligase-1 [Nocardioides luteus]|uniref:DNA ligase n=1 Tax=Nocardioides luteus TaxID=1844 RepID=A0ABQ5T0N7_9ACTN|nr:ATP-dependent DNA ligase [Nocardioides luteus]MDR7310737.1 DNA ligase-1 [Nocardioides luteus]GGR40939.1 putative DNA ligase [Nocardioides luteus]GLJ69483.1 putative DNA ligase [Nocardioides luteus]